MYEEVVFASTPYGAISVPESVDVLMTEGEKGKRRNLLHKKTTCRLGAGLSMRERNTFILYSVLIATLGWYKKGNVYH